MITNRDTSVALSSLGSVDGGSIWRFESSSHDNDSIELSDADYLHLFCGDAHHFTVQHT